MILPLRARLKDAIRGLFVQGKIFDQTFEEWNRETGAKKLPEPLPQYGGAKEGRNEPQKTKNSKVADESYFSALLMAKVTVSSFLSLFHYSGI